MYLEWVGFFKFTMLMFLILLTLVLLMFLRTLYRLISKSMNNPLQKQMVVASMFMMSFSVVVLSVKQAISFGFIVFLTPIHEAWFNIITGALTVVLGCYILCYMLKRMKLMNEEQKKEPEL